MAGSSALDWLWRIELLLYCTFFALLLLSSNPAQPPILGIPVSQLILGLGPAVFILPVLLAYFDYRMIKEKMKLEMKTRTRATFFIVEYLATSVLIFIAAPLIVRGINPFGIFTMLSLLTLFPYLLLRGIMRFEQIVGEEIEPVVDLYPQYQKKYEPVMRVAAEAMKLATPPIMAPVEELMTEEPQRSAEKFTLKKALGLLIPSLVCAGFVIGVGCYAPLMFGWEYKLAYVLFVWADACVLYAVIASIRSTVPAGVWNFLNRPSGYHGSSPIVLLVGILFVPVIFGVVFFTETINGNYRNYQLAKYPELKYCERYDPIAPRNNAPCYADFAKKFGDRDICYLAKSSKDECLKLAENSRGPS